MKLDFDTCYRAVQNRDAAYDGRFFTAVTTTGIFCRPVCPAVTPKAAHCLFYPSSAAAMDAGYRPCLRCRPEAAPNSPAWNGVKTTVARALKLIDDGALAREGVADLAARLGVGERHLRRLLVAHTGAGPKALEQTRRALLAKKLITDSDRAMIDIADAAGFGSLRQFNDTFRKLYGKPPTALRKSRSPTLAGHGVGHAHAVQ